MFKDKVREILTNYKDYLLTREGFRLSTHPKDNEIFWIEFNKAIDQILSLIPEEGEVVAEGTMTRQICKSLCSYITFHIPDIFIEVQPSLNTAQRVIALENRKVQIIIREVK